MSVHCMVHLEMGDVVEAEVLATGMGGTFLRIHFGSHTTMFIHQDRTPGQFNVFCEFFKVGEFAPKEEESVAT